MKRKLEQAAVKVAPEKFTWMKYKGTKAKLLTHTKRNGEIVKARLEPNDVYGHRTVKQRSTGKELVQIVLKSDGMDLAYNLAVRSFNTHILKVSKTTVLPKQFKKPVDVKAIDKKAPVEPKAGKTPSKAKPKNAKPATKTGSSELKATKLIFQQCGLDAEDLEWVLSKVRDTNYTLTGIARFVEFVYNNAGQDTNKLFEDIDGFFALSRTSGVKSGLTIDDQGQPLIDNFKKNYLEQEVDTPVPEVKPSAKKKVDRTTDVEKFIRAFLTQHQGDNFFNLTIDTNFPDRTTYSMTAGLNEKPINLAYEQLMDEIKDEFGKLPKTVSEEVEERTFNSMIVKYEKELHGTEFTMRLRKVKNSVQVKLMLVEFIFPT